MKKEEIEENLRIKLNKIDGEIAKNIKVPNELKPMPIPTKKWKQ